VSLIKILKPVVTTLYVMWNVEMWIVIGIIDHLISALTKLIGLACWCEFLERLRIAFIVSRSMTTHHKGLYLHGMSYFIAPKEQTHVASIAWFDQQFVNQ
jgi:hypothetical protein